MDGQVQLYMPPTSWGEKTVINLINGEINIIFYGMQEQVLIMYEWSGLSGKCLQRLVSQGPAFLWKS
jgi:hypothetical protein